MDRKLVRTLSIGEREQLSKFEKIDEQKFYTIQCRLNCFCLRSQPRSYKYKKGDHLKITGNLLQKNYMNQLWMFKKVSQNQFQIIHVKTDLVITIQDFEGRLQVGKMKQNQKFEIMAFKNGFVRIKDGGGFILQIDGTLQSSDYNQRDERQLFRLNSYGIFEIPWLKDTIFILTGDGISSLDLVNAARQNQQQIIVYKRNFRMNQRWKFTILSENKNYISVYIMSALTDMYIVINHDSKGLMQASYPEQWLVEQTQIKQFIYLKHSKVEEYLSYNELNQIYFSQTKKCKWYIQNGMQGLHLKKSGLNRSISI